ncbi:MAG: TIGR03118 family protein [Acidobacteriales bacterium]|nr:TIGR03118 family protein [Terriglobales bacterium]
MPLTRFTFAPALALALAATPIAHGQRYDVKPLVTDTGAGGTTTDIRLVNPWGVARSSGGPFWVSDNGTGKSTLYDGNGVPQGLIVTVAPIPKSDAPATPTGVVFNGNPNSFLLEPGAAAIFIFVTEDGTISGWNPGLNLHNSLLRVNQSPGSVFKGATIGQIAGADYLFAADFRVGEVAVYNSQFHKVTLSPGAFTDSKLPAGYAPFNVQNIGGNIFVAFAKQDDVKHDEVDGAGNGFVDVFNTSGKLLLRLEHNDALNAPWAMTMASQDFGAFSHDILVGQFGNGWITAFDPVTGRFLGLLNDAGGNIIAINGLWGLSFGNGKTAGPQNTLFFSAGTDNEHHGTFGTLTPAAGTLTQGNDR